MDTLPLWVLTVAYAGHIAEEYILDWRSWAQQISGLQLPWADFFVVNFAVIVFGFSCSIIGFGAPFFSYLFVGLAMSNALLAHIGSTIVKRKFSPGLLSAVFLFLPICFWAYYNAYQKGIMSWTFFLCTFFGGTLIMLYPVLLQYIKNKNLFNIKNG